MCFRIISLCLILAQHCFEIQLNWIEFNFVLKCFWKTLAMFSSKWSKYEANYRNDEMKRYSRDLSINWKSSYNHLEHLILSHNTKQHDYFKKALNCKFRCKSRVLLNNYHFFSLYFPNEYFIVKLSSQIKIRINYFFSFFRPFNWCFLSL